MDLWLPVVVIVVLAIAGGWFLSKRKADSGPSTRGSARGTSRKGGARRTDELDTVQAWEPHATRIL